MDRFFFDTYGLIERDLESYLAVALEGGGDYADLYFECTTTSSFQVDESLVKSATEGVSLGCGIRVVAVVVGGYHRGGRIIVVAIVSPVGSGWLVLLITK